jgi:hypothetical protein
VILSALPLCVASTRSFLAASCESTIGFTMATASWNKEQLQNNAFGSEVERLKMSDVLTSLVTTSHSPSLARMRNSRELSTTSSCLQAQSRLCQIAYIM